MARRRLRKHPPHIELTAFINLIVVLVPFLLSTAVFTRLAVMELSLPPPNSNAAFEKVTGELQLEVVIRRDAIEVGDRIGGLFQRFDRRVDGSYDLVGLGALIVQVKARFPEQRSASVLAEPETPYEHIVAVMDAVRDEVRLEGPQVIRNEMFPVIAIGDAPVRKVAGTDARPAKGAS